MPRSREEKDYMHSAIITKITELFFHPCQQIQAYCSRGFHFLLPCTGLWWNCVQQTRVLDSKIFYPQLKNLQTKTKKKKLKMSLSQTVS